MPEQNSSVLLIFHTSIVDIPYQHSTIHNPLNLDTLIILLHTLLQGAFITPTAYTLTGVMAVNGSIANGGCPSPCVGVIPGITTCDCLAHSTLAAVATSGVFIDGVIPTIDDTERNTDGDIVWAAPLFTVRRSTEIVTLGFLFPASVVLHEVELYLFHCPAWGIGADRIVIHNGAIFPQFIRLFDSIGSMALSVVERNCTSLTRVSIPLHMAMSTTSYFIEFFNPSGDLIEWVHIAEVRFSDQPITTTMMASTESTTRELTTTSGKELPSM